MSGAYIREAQAYIALSELLDQCDRMKRLGQFEAASALFAIAQGYDNDEDFDRARAVYLADIDKEVQQ